MTSRVLASKQNNTKVDIILQSCFRITLWATSELKHVQDMVCLVNESVGTNVNRFRPGKKEKERQEILKHDLRFDYKRLHSLRGSGNRELKKKHPRGLNSSFVFSVHSIISILLTELSVRLSKFLGLRFTKREFIINWQRLRQNQRKHHVL